MQKTFRIEYWENGAWHEAGEVSESTAGKAVKYARRIFALAKYGPKDVRAVQI